MNVVFLGKQNVENRWDILREFWQNSIAVRKRWRKVDRTHAMNPNKSSNLVRAANSWLFFSYGLHLFITADCLIANYCVLHYIIYIYYANSGFSGLLSLLNMFRFVGWVGPIRLGYKSTHVCNVCNSNNSNIWKSNCLLRSCFRFPRFSVLFHIEQWLRSTPVGWWLVRGLYFPIYVYIYIFNIWGF